MSTNSDIVVELAKHLQQSSVSGWVSRMWSNYDNQRSEARARWAETSAYVFATDTSHTANAKLPWMHKTTMPKITQIRDNLHSNYLQSLFPNDKWLTWMAYDKESSKYEVAKTIESYMENKLREGEFRIKASKLLYDYIDYGNAFAMPSFEARYKETELERTVSFIGPKTVRIDPYNIVFNPTAVSFENTPKIVRSIKTIGELKKLAQTHPEHKFWERVIERRRHFQQMLGGHTREDMEKAAQYRIDGFGSLYEYYQTDYVEILEFYGDYHTEEGELQTGRMITIVDRAEEVRNVPINTYSGKDPIRHVGWRLRPNNLWAMGPLDNLIGLQYQIDHRQNMKATALDLMVLPPKKIIGAVEEFVWQPLEEIHISEDGDVQELAQSLSGVIAADNEIDMLEQRMELYAGAPREAMGIRTPGEKTAFEVQALENAAGRIFQEKTIQFELFLEAHLNDMLEIAHRNLDMGDLIRVIDNDLGVAQFKEITKEDITANGILRPIGARHFAQKAQDLQNLVGILNVPTIAQKIDPHMSGIALTKFIEDIVDLRGYKIFTPNIAIGEMQETEALASQAQEDNIMEQSGGFSEEEIASMVVQDENEVVEQS